MKNKKKKKKRMRFPDIPKSCQNLVDFRGSFGIIGIWFSYIPQGRYFEPFASLSQNYRLIPGSVSKRETLGKRFFKMELFPRADRVSTKLRCHFPGVTLISCAMLSPFYFLFEFNEVWEIWSSQKRMLITYCFHLCHLK